MRASALAAAAMLAFGIGPASAATTWYVATSGTDSADCGTTAAPCKTIQFGIDLTDDGDTVVVGPGTFNECVTVIPGTGVGHVIVLSASLLNPLTTPASIIDGADVCDEASGTPGPVVTVYDQSVLSGFTVKNGGDSGIWGLGAVVITNNVISDNTTTTVGGGVRVTTGTNLTDPTTSAQINFNTIENNTSGGSGAGVYVDATADGTPSVVDIDGNIIKTNTAGSVAGASGGGMTVVTGTVSATDVSVVTLKTNVLDGNIAAVPAAGGADAFGGGLYVATGGGTGLGSESIVVGGIGIGNAIRNNVSQGIGGGLSVDLRPITGSQHSIVVGNNYVSANTAILGGGGLHASSLATDCSTGTNALTIARNSFVGNHVTGDAGDPANVGGGGLYVVVDASRTPDGVVTVQISQNGLRSNDTTTFGGGASLEIRADDDPNLDGNTLPTAASLQFENNLVALNMAIDADAAAAVGGGVALSAQAIGAQASATVTQRFLTVVGNQSDAGAGGLEWSATTAPDTVSGPGNVAIELSNSILQGNDGFAVGGPILPSATVVVSIDYNDAFENVVGDYEAQLGASTGTNGNVAVDPALDQLYVPPLCSPTVDLGDPSLDPENEPLPNGNRVNLGHLGNTIDATRTFPDVNGDGTVDGLDVLGIAVSFNAALATGDPRYFIAADRDLNGLVDGADLAYVAAFFAQSCPATAGGTP